MTSSQAQPVFLPKPPCKWRGFLGFCPLLCVLTWSAQGITCLLCTDCYLTSLPSSHRPHTIVHQHLSPNIPFASPERPIPQRSQPAALTMGPLFFLPGCQCPCLCPDPRNISPTLLQVSPGRFHVGFPLTLNLSPTMLQRDHAY